MSDSSINVAKFGGTSVANYASMLNCVKVVKGNPDTKVVVVSASAGVTNILVELAHKALTKDEISTYIEQIRAIEFAILHDLGAPTLVADYLSH